MADSPPIEILTIGSFDPLAGGFHDVDYVGRTIDGYEVRELIGRGGMADVYRARDVTLRLDVALKVLRPRLASPQMCARLVQEAQAAAAIQHPHMLRVFKVGALPGSVYLAMELLRGLSFRHFLEEHGGRVGWRDAVAMLTPAMDALHEAHALGLVHRDIKADNLFVTSRGRDPRFVIVLDLGIAKAETSFRGADGPTTTPHGCVIGTPTHMAPEQVEGKPLDRRCDVYAMGVTLYHALTGRLPFPGIPGAPLQTMQRHLSERPPGFDEVAADAGIPRAIEDVVMRALAKQRDDRPASMRALADELTAVVADAVVHVQPRAPRRGAIVGLWVALVMLMAIGVGTVWADSVVEPVPGRLSIAETVLPVVVSERWMPDVKLQAPIVTATGVVAPRVVHRVEDRAVSGEPRRDVILRDAAIAGCRQRFGGDHPRDLAIEVTIEIDGRVSQARVRTKDMTFETACIEAAVLGIQLAPGRVRESFRTLLKGERP